MRHTNIIKKIKQKWKKNILTDDMLQAAFAFRKQEPWNVLGDYNVFAVKLSCGETGYCSVMGEAGIMHGLGLYVGRKQFSSFLRSLTIKKEPHYEFLENITLLNYIVCSFDAAKDIEANDKKRIREFSQRTNQTIPRKNGWPNFIKYKPNHAPWRITDKQDAQNLTEAMRATVFLTSYTIEHPSENVGFGPEGDYPDYRGGKTVPMLISTGEEQYEWSTTQLPAFEDEEYPVVQFDNDIMAHRIKKLPKDQPLCCRMLHMHQPALTDQHSTPIYPHLLLVVGKEDGYAIPIMGKDINIDAKEMLNKLGETICDIGKKPEEIETAGDKTYNLLKHFCERCDIPLHKKKKMDEVWEEVATYMYTVL